MDTAPSPQDIPRQLWEFALFALDHAAGSVVPRGGPLVPFSMIDSGSDKLLTRYPGDLEAGQAVARQEIHAAEGAKLAALAWDGSLTSDEGDPEEAVFVQAASREFPHSIVVAQRYGARGKLLRRVAIKGGATLVGYGDPLF